MSGVRRALWMGVAIVASLGLAIELWHAHGEHEGVLERLVPVLSLSYEANLPTWFSSGLLLIGGLLAGAIAHAIAPGERGRVAWWGVAVGLGYASLDEAIELHEHLGGHLETSGVLYFDWIIPATGVVVVLAALYLPFVRALPAATRRACSAP